MHMTKEVYLTFKNISGAILSAKEFRIFQWNLQTLGDLHILCLSGAFKWKYPAVDGAEGPLCVHMDIACCSQ